MKSSYTQDIYILSADCAENIVKNHISFWTENYIAVTIFINIKT